MRPFDLIAILIVMAAGFSYINLRFLRLPAAIGLMAQALVFSVAVMVIGRYFPGFRGRINAVLHQIDFNEILLRGMLGFLLFAGALHVDLGDLARYRWSIASLATLGVAVSTAVVGGLTFGMLYWIGMPTRLLDCLLFGALISPTDPIAVIGLLKRVGVPKSLEVQIAGESLFNDGVGVVVFTSLLGLGGGGAARFEFGSIAGLLLREMAGGIALGLVVGWAAFRIVRTVDEYKVEILVSLAMVAGGYALAGPLEVSGPIAMVVAGLLIGNHARRHAMSGTTRQHLNLFWELVDETLNAILFMLIGLQVLDLAFTGRTLAAGLLAIPIVLAGRLVSVGLPIRVLRRWHELDPFTIRILTWGGLRGGISVALALSLPGGSSGGNAVPGRVVILVMTYVVVVFSILVQGLTVGPVARRWLARDPNPPGGGGSGPNLAPVGR